MEKQKPGMFVPALIGGAAAGVLSGVPLLSCFCCLWIIGGAMLSAYLLSKDSPVALKAGDGAIVGIFAGIVAAVTNAHISIPLYALNREFFYKIMEMLAEYTDEMPAGWENLMERGTGAGISAFFLVNLLFSALVFAALGALGGLIGMSLFGKKPTSPDQKPTDVT